MSPRNTTTGSLIDARGKGGYARGQAATNPSHSHQTAGDLEVDQSNFAPEVLQPGLERPIEGGPENVLHTQPPFPHPEDVASKEVASNSIGKGSPGSNSPAKRSPRRLTWIAIGLVVAILLLALALGVGLGVGLHKQDNSSVAPTATASGAAISSVAVSSPPASSQTPSSVPLNHGALNDTSLAAVSFNGDRHLFFQDINSTIRHKRYSGSAGSWLPSNDWIANGPVPKNNTPIAAIECQTIGGSGDVINVFYIATNDTLAVASYVPVGFDQGEEPVLNNSYLTLPSTRSLSVARLQSNVSSTPNVPTDSVPSVLKDELFLFYESPESNVTILHGLYYLVGTSQGFTDKWVWQNVSDSFYPQNSSQSQGGWLGSPFSASTSDTAQENGAAAGLSAFFFNPASVYDATSPAYLDIYLSNFTQIASSQSFIYEPFQSLGSLSNSTFISALSSGDNDIETYNAGAALVSNGSLHDQILGSPTSKFPFGRLAYLSGNSSTYVYHQLNETHLLEEIAVPDGSGSQWATPNQIVISTDGS